MAVTVTVLYYIPISAVAVPNYKMSNGIRAQHGLINLSHALSKGSPDLSVQKTIGWANFSYLCAGIYN